MPNPITTIVEGIPELAPLPPSVRAELLARIAYACDWCPAANQELWPQKIQVWVETLHDDPSISPASIDFFELHHLYFPANGHGTYSNDALNGVWYRVGCQWDDEESHTIQRDWFGNLEHWM